MPGKSVQIITFINDIGGSRGGGGGPKFFHFHTVFGKKRIG